MSSRLRAVLFLIILGAILWFVLGRVRFFVPVSLWDLLAFILVLAVVIFLLVDHLINRTR